MTSIMGVTLARGYGKYLFNSSLEDAKSREKLTYNMLINYMRKGLRNGNWKKLDAQERALFRAAIWYAKFKDLVSNKIVTLILGIVEKLRATISTRIFKLGQARAQEMLVSYEEKGVFKLFPKLKTWLLEPSYIFWLGTTMNVQLYERD